MSTPLEADYIIVGGGLSGCALASLLSRLPTKPSVLLFEAGPDPSPEHDVVSPMGGFALQNSTLDWQYKTAAVPHNNGRTHVLTAGKTLGGGSMLNYGGWSRGDAADYDDWSRWIGDSRWSYAKLLPSFGRSERFVDKTVDSTQHGHDGALHITSARASHPLRLYPLGEPLRDAWQELGVRPVRSAGGGANLGIDEFWETWIEGMRQPAPRAYPLDKVQVYTHAPVAELKWAKGMHSRPRVEGVVLCDDRTAIARREVILAAGTLRTPLLLQISGIGPSSMLKELDIPIRADLAAVGSAYFDHFALFQLWKLHESEKGMSLGHPDLADPAFVAGFPSDCVVNEGIPREILESALDADGVTGAEKAALLQPGRCFIETLVMYHPIVPGVPVDGSWVVTSVMLTLPSSRGRIALSSSSSLEPSRPHIEPNYFNTALDRAALVYGTRRSLKLMLDTKALRPYVAAEAPPPGLEPLTLESSDADIERRIRAAGIAHFHAAGSCPLGSALDTELRVKGVDCLRVCDASVFPTPVGGHPQATCYMLAERASEMIAAELVPSGR